MTEITAPSIRQQTITVGKPTGKLVKKNPVNSTVNFVKQGKYLTDAINGKGDDYTVGKINDLTTRLGSLGIAAILSSITKNPVAKGMEFVGFASFFTSMALWPKLISSAIKAKAGFDVNQEYVDSYGRQKRFFEDPQYLPWDLWSSKEIDKIGDKLHVSKDIPNRSDETKKKMKQIATQSNTLWMMTAGFATPLMASLMGNYASKYAEKLTEATRVQKAINKTNIKDFTKADDDVALTFKQDLENIFIKTPAKLFGLTKKAENKDIKQTLIDLDAAYDSIFGKSNDSAYEFKKATLLYDNVINNEKLVNYDERLGLNIIKDENGNIVRKIKTKNADGISMFGDKWKTIPNKMADILGISPKEFKTITNNINNATKGEEKDLSSEIAESLIKKFAGKENKKALDKALKDIDTTLEPSIIELNKAAKSLGDGIESAINALQDGDEIKEFIAKAQKTRLDNKVINTKVSWYSPVRILDIIAKHSDEEMTDATRAALKSELSDYISGVTPHHIHNDFDDIIKGEFPAQLARYNAGIKKFFGNGTLSEATKNMLKEDSSLAKDIEATGKDLTKKFINVSTNKSEHFNDICEWLGKTPENFIKDAAKQNGIYRGWLKKAAGAFAILTGITLFAITQFGKTNKYNPNIEKQN
ncbi:MAG: hypothetical protein MJ229_02395 [bacterium]|nr:hypothetical protein [bacterium]